MNRTPITITPRAVQAIREKTALLEDAIGLRLSVKTTGCSGNSYMMEHVLEEGAVTEDDRIEQDGAILYIPKQHSWMLFGMIIDYAEDSLSSGFIFTNPNESGRCGCGESFSVDTLKTEG